MTESTADIAPGQPARLPEAVRGRCVYCLGNGHLQGRQVLLRGSRLYLCAPRGQMVEGFLVIAPLACVGSLSALPAGWFPELKLMTGVVAKFYREAYGVEGGTLYEQGRGGGGRPADEAGGFPHHSHLCCLPLDLDLHTLLGRRYVRRDLSGPEALSSVVPDSPYVYVEGPDAAGRRRRCAYAPATDEGRLELERMRLKPTVATLAGLPGRGDWRTHPGDDKLERLISRFTEFRRSLTPRGERHGQEP